MSADQPRMAGSKIMWLLTDPLGEEISEGVLGGLLAGAGQLGADQSLGQTALQTATAMLGGVGLGMAGRRVGGFLGNRMHEGALADQHGMLATLGRTLGSESTVSGVADQLRDYKGIIQEALVNETSTRMAREAATDPAGFAKKYGVTAEMFAKMAPGVQAGRVGSEVLRTAERLSPEERTRLLDQAMGSYKQVEDAITREAAGQMDSNIDSIAEMMKNDPAGRPKIGDIDMADAIESLRRPAKPVTGRHVGRMMGRLLGDEVGVIGGLLAGGVLADQLGMKSGKDKRIEELEKQLERGG